MGRLVKNAASVLAIVLVFMILVPTFNFMIVRAQTVNNFEINGVPSLVTAGQSFNGVTVTVYDVNGNIWTGYTGQIYFTSSDPSVTLPYTSSSPYTFTTGAGGDNGVHTFSGFNLVTAGSQTITVTDGSRSATTGSINVTHADAVQVAVSPMTATIVAGSQQTYAATASDAFGNTWDVSSPSTTLWLISYGSGGVWTGSTFRSEKTGTFTVTAVYAGMFAAQGLLTVTPSVAISLTVSPKTPSVTAGLSTTFTALARDNFGNVWDVTSSTSWSISPTAGGSWANNVYTSAKAGVWLVTGTFQGFSDSASLTVHQSFPVSVTISPSNPTFAAGTQVTFTAIALDHYGNTWDVTGSTVWSITSGAAGSWNGNVYSCVKAGIWTVTGNYQGMIGTTTLTVSYASVYRVTVSPSNPNLMAGQTQQFTASASDVYGNVWDVTNLADWSITVAAGGSWTGSAYTAAMAGTWTVTANYLGIFDTATLTVAHGSAVNLIVGSTTSSTTAGSMVTFTATAFDSFGNSWDVSGSTHWIIDSGAHGSWSSNLYTAAKAGTWAVTGSYNGLFDSASLNVTPGTAISLAVSPLNSDVTAGFTQTYTAIATDSYSNSWDVSSITSWSIDSSAAGSWSNNIYSSAKAGTWTVKGTYNSLSGTSSLTVTHSYPVRIQINPQTVSITAGASQKFTTTAFDYFGNSWDSTSSATFLIDQQAAGTLNGNTYTSAKAGTWTVHATSLGLSDTATLIVNHSSPVGITLSPNEASITAGSTQAYTATAIDSFNNLWDVSNLAAWTMSSGAGGSWTSNVYQSYSAGNWDVTATYLGLSSSVYLTVNHAPATSVSISPGSSTITTGSNEAYIATATDSYHNTWDATTTTLWSIQPGAGGYWSANTYYSANTGTWQISGSISGLNGIVLTGTASLIVNHGSAISIVITPSTSTLTAGWPQAFTAKAYDSVGNQWDVTSSTSWTIDSGAGGSWSSNTYYSHSAGTWFVTGNYLDLTDTATLTVNHAQGASITVGSSSNNIIAGSTVTFTATASDLFDNVWDITSSTSWTIDPAAGATTSGNGYSFTRAGSWRITGNLGSLSQCVYLTVNHAGAVSISLTPTDETVMAGSEEAYSVNALDNFGNSWDITTLSTLKVTTDAGGLWSGNTYTPTKVGTWTITALYSSFSSITSIAVVHGSPTSIVIAPRSQTINAGTSVTFVATVSDAYSNSWDVSNSAVWLIESNAQGSWTNNVYTAAKVGTWQVSCFYFNLLLDSTLLTVNHGPLTSLTVAPATSTIYEGATQTFTAQGDDTYGNMWDATSLTSWLISNGAGGHWTGNVYTSANPGTWTITSTSGSISGSAQITVSAYSPADFLHTGKVTALDLFYFINAYNYYGQYGTITDPKCDFTHDGKLNFQDIVPFVIAYIEATQP